MRAWPLLVLAGCRPLLRGPSSLARPALRSSEGPSRPVALLLDGDQVGPRWFEPAKAAAGARGPVRVARCYAAPHCRKTWADDLRRHELDFVAVPREGPGDPNDRAICAGAAELLRADPDLQLALATTDRDFLPLLEKLRPSGAFAVVPYISDVETFRRAGVDVLQFDSGPRQRTPDFAEALEASGRHYDPEEADGVFASVGSQLRDLGYLRDRDRDFPSVRALGFFFHVNGMRGAQLYPWCVGAYEAHEELQRRPDGAAGNPGGLQFFEAAAGRQRAGSQGRWAVLATGEGCVPRVLRWLEYDVGPDGARDAESEQVWAEALQAFWRRNAKALRLNLKASALDASAAFGAEEREALLEAAFQDDLVRQQWRPAPADADVRAWLRRLGRIEDAGAPRHEVLAAVRAELGVATRCYSLAMLRAQERILGRSDPLQRKPTKLSSSPTSMQ